MGKIYPHHRTEPPLEREFEALWSAVDSLDRRLSGVTATVPLSAPSAPVQNPALEDPIVIALLLGG